MFYKVVYVILSCLFRVLYRMKVTGREKVPPGGGIVCCNHSSNMDPVLVAVSLKCADHPRFMGKAELFSVPVLKNIIVALGAYPIHRGQNDLGAIKASLKFLKNGEKILMFPEGSRLAADDLSAAKQGAAMLAHKAGVPLIPMYLTRGRILLRHKVEAVFGDPIYPVEGENQSRAQLYENTIETLVKHVKDLKMQTKEYKK